MINITENGNKLTYTIDPIVIPESLKGKHFPGINQQLAKIDPTIPTLAAIDEKLVEPFEPIHNSSKGMLIVHHEGVTYHAKLL